jgi:hypothetical protein
MGVPPYSNNYGRFFFSDRQNNETILYYKNYVIQMGKFS